MKTFTNIKYIQPGDFYHITGSSGFCDPGTWICSKATSDKVYGPRGELEYKLTSKGWICPSATAYYIPKFFRFDNVEDLKKNWSQIEKIGYCHSLKEAMELFKKYKRWHN